MDSKISAAIRDYRKEIEKCPDTWLAHCRKQLTLTDAIQIAAVSEDHLGKRHPHQYRLKNDLLIFVEKLKSQELRIKDADDFDILFKIVYNAGSNLSGIGEMSIYDTTERIGAFLNLFPNKIYLHAGTRIGAKKILGRIEGETITKDKLPLPFRTSNLSCAEIENILCMYKDKF